MSALLDSLLDERRLRDMAFEPRDVRHDPATTTEAELQHMIAAMLARIDTLDVLDELADSDARIPFEIAIARSDARLIGQVVLAVRQNYAERLVLREIYGDTVQAPSIKAVLADVFVRATAAQERRMAQEPSVYRNEGLL